MRLLLNLFGITILLSLVTSASLGQSLDGIEWKLKKEKNGIRAYAGKLPDSKYLAFRVEGQMSGRLQDIPSILQDESLFDVIFMDIAEAWTSYTEGDSLVHFYLNMDAPWPAKNRAAIFTNLYVYDAENDRLIIESGSTDKNYPDKKSTIQLTECFGHWSFSQVDADTMDVYYQFHANPGGVVPAWIINTKTVEAPMYTFRKISEILENESFEARSFSFF